MKRQRAYRDLAGYYDLIYSDKDYRREAGTIRRLISKYKKSGGNTLLEAGCGTGLHLKYFKGWFECTGTDINREMLAVAKKNVKGVVLKRADMVTMNLGKKFDVVTSLFSAIGYVRTYARLSKTLRNFSKHLKRGGVVIVEPWISKSDWKGSKPHMKTYQDKNVTIARIDVPRRKGNTSIIDFHYLIAERNGGVVHLTDRHELGLFGVGRTLGIMKRAGLKAMFLKKGFGSRAFAHRGLFIGIKE